MSRIRHIGVVAAAISALATAICVQAQEQTPENAVKFLDLYAGQNRFPFGLTGHLEGAGRLAQPVPAISWVGVMEYDPAKPCWSHFKTSDGSDTRINWTKTEVISSSWSEVMKSVDPRAVPMIELRRTDASYSYTIWPGDEQKAARLNNALRFMKDKCDPMKATGF